MIEEKECCYLEICGLRDHLLKSEEKAKGKSVNIVIKKHLDTICFECFIFCDYRERLLKAFNKSEA